jgi:hypothetical protein
VLRASDRVNLGETVHVKLHRGRLITEVKAKE